MTIAAAAGASARGAARSAGTAPMTAMKIHGALPASPKVRSNSIAGRPTQNWNVIEGALVSACACEVPKK